MGCAASSPLARALNPARFMNHAKEASASRDPATGTDDIPYPLHGVADGVKERVGAVVDGLEEKIGSTIHTVSDQVSHAAHEVESKVSGAVGTVMHGAEEAVAGAQDMLSGIQSHVKEVLPASEPPADHQQQEKEMQELLDSLDEVGEAEEREEHPDPKPGSPKAGDSAMESKEGESGEDKGKQEPEIETINM